MIKELLPLLLGFSLMAGCAVERETTIKGDQPVVAEKKTSDGTYLFGGFPSLDGVSVGMPEAKLLAIIHRRKLDYKRQQGATSADATYYVQARTGVIFTFSVHAGCCWGATGPEKLPTDWNVRFKNDAPCIDTEIAHWPTSKAHVSLLSLDPGARNWRKAVTDQSFFHGFKILGKADITTKAEKSALLKSFAQGIREGAVPSMCFNPQHGLRVVIGPSTNDFVICFECSSVIAYGFNLAQGFTISDSPSGTFNNSLDKHHLTKSEPLKGQPDSHAFE
jgi:hypothetical protein